MPSVAGCLRTVEICFLSSEFENVGWVLLTFPPSRALTRPRTSVLKANFGFLYALFARVISLNETPITDT
jgi:hypothetical protein